VSIFALSKILIIELASFQLEIDSRTSKQSGHHVGVYVKLFKIGLCGLSRAGLPDGLFSNQKYQFG
jgi:hypothetical protein